MVSGCLNLFMSNRVRVFEVGEEEEVGIVIESNVFVGFDSFVFNYM